MGCAYGMYAFAVLSSASSYLGSPWVKSGGKISVDPWVGVRGVRTVDRACADCLIQTIHRNQHFQAVPEIWCWHQNMTSRGEIIIALFSVGGFSGLWGVLRLMGCLSISWHWTFCLKKALQGKRNGEGNNHLLAPPVPALRLTCRGSTCHQHPREAGEHRVLSVGSFEHGAVLQAAKPNWQYCCRPWRSQLSLLLLPGLIWKYEDK